MGGFGAFSGSLDSLSGVACIEDGNRSQTHQGAVPGAVKIGWSAERVSCFQEGGKGRPGGIADVETGPRAAQVALLPPADVPFHLIPGIESPTFDKAFGEAEGHGCVVGPLAWFQIEGAIADHVGNWCEATRWLELQGGSQGVANGKTEQAAPVSFELFYTVRHAAIIVLSPRREPSGFGQAFPGMANGPLRRYDEAL